MRVLLLLIFPCFAALAHDSPEHKIDDLSFQIARSGKSPTLLMERAIEHRTLGQLDDAAADFEAASQLDPKLTAARKELSLVQLAQGKTDLALRTINRALALPVGRAVPGEPPPDLLMARAEIQTARQDYRSALQDCDAAFRQPTTNPEWYLLRAQLQRRLGQFRNCLADLRDGFAKTGSAVLEEEIIDSMMDAGEHKAALKKIEHELNDSRWRSSWLLKRARVRLALSDAKAAKRDLRSALAELNLRITAAAPDVTLIIDRGLAYALLGDRSRAQEDLRRARDLSPDPFSLWRLEKLLGSRPTG